LIVVTQHYDTLQAIGADTNSNLILLPNSPQAGSDMLNNMIASFSASNQVGELMKRGEKELQEKTSNYLKTRSSRNTGNRRIEYLIQKRGLIASFSFSKPIFYKRNCFI
jgi:hypothetical protein